MKYIDIKYVELVFLTPCLVLFSVSADCGVGRWWFLLHSDTLWVWEGVSVWIKLQQGRGVPRGGHPLQWQAGVLACYSHREEPSRSGKGHHPQQKQVTTRWLDFMSVFTKSQNAGQTCPCLLQCMVSLPCNVLRILAVLKLAVPSLWHIR